MFQWLPLGLAESQLSRVRRRTTKLTYGWRVRHGEFTAAAFSFQTNATSELPSVGEQGTWKLVLGWVVAWGVKVPYDGGVAACQQLGMGIANPGSSS